MEDVQTYQTMTAPEDTTSRGQSLLVKGGLLGTLGATGFAMASGCMAGLYEGLGAPVEIDPMHGAYALGSITGITQVALCNLV